MVLASEIHKSKKSVRLIWRKVQNTLNHTYCVLSGSPAKSGPLDFGTKNNFPSFFVSEKGLKRIYKKAIYYFPIPYFCFATSQN